MTVFRRRLVTCATTILSQPSSNDTNIRQLELICILVLPLLDRRAMLIVMQWSETAREVAYPTAIVAWIPSQRRPIGRRS
jgi:hypothetical protein